MSEQPSLNWIADGDWIHFIGIIIWMLLSFLAIAFCIAALVSVLNNNVGLAIVQALLAAVIRPQYGWRG
jgi:hypothetical protein